MLSSLTVFLVQGGAESISQRDWGVEFPERIGELMNSKQIQASSHACPSNSGKPFQASHRKELR